MDELNKIETAKQKQHAKGKLFVTERLKKLFDEGKYKEILDKGRRIGVLICEGRISGKKVIVAAQDFTYRGGTLGRKIGENIARAQDIAITKKCPFITINDSGGARIQEGIDSLAGYGEIFYRNVMASGFIPQISVILGPCDGGAVYSPGITDFVFMVENIAQMYITGPKVVKSVTGSNITAEELGGFKVHNRESGVSHFCYPDEEMCFEELRRLIAMLPANCEEKTALPRKELSEKAEAELAIPENTRIGYDVRSVIRAVADEGSFMEVSAEFAMSIVVGFATLCQTTIGVVGNQPSCLAGSLDCDTSDKAARFVRFCDAFGIPLITFTDVPGYLPGVSQETKGIIRHGAKLLYAFSEATVPKINIILRKAYGGAYIAMNSKHLGADYVIAWPTAEVAVMGEDGAVEILYAKELKNLSGKEKTDFLDKKKAEYKAEVINYKHGLEMGYIDQVIKPSETRETVVALLNDALRKKKLRKAKILRKKHGNIPL